MANTYTQLYFHVVFAVQGRRSLLQANHKEELYKYINGIIKKRDQKLLAINGTENHLHILISTKPTIILSDIIRDIKAGSSGYINQQKWTYRRFNWQEGFGAFTCSSSHVPTLIRYIQNQQVHHGKKGFRDEFIGFLKEFNVQFDDRYLFSDPT